VQIDELVIESILSLIVNATAQSATSLADGAADAPRLSIRAATNWLSRRRAGSA
jgi:hypothetical protein